MAKKRGAIKSTLNTVGSIANLTEDLTELASLHLKAEIALQVRELLNELVEAGYSLEEATAILQA